MLHGLKAFFFVAVFLMPALLYAQEQNATYFSQLDNSLTIRRVAVLPATDNTDGIYARPVEAQLIKLVRESHRWDYADSNVSGMPPLIELEENPDRVQKLIAPLDADAILAAALTKGPSGLSIRVDLFMKNDGKLLAQEIVRDLPRFELAEIRDQVSQLYKRLLVKIPYEGLILSRQGNRVTVNLGKSDGLVKDQTVTAVQILSVNRHPKFNFLISSEKEILGTIKILKVDETLSFGSIVTEKERGAIRKSAKIAGLNVVKYGDPTSLNEGGANTDLSSRPDANVSFGKEAKEWLPVHPPSFGAVGAKLGFGSYQTSAAVSSNSLDAKTLVYPSLNLFGEMWITPEWTVRADIIQGIATTPNPRPGSQPPELNNLLSRYSMEVGYNFLLRDDFFGPKLNLSMGFMTYRMYVDDSTPTGLTTANFSGLMLGFGGSFPVTDDKLWYAGGRLNLFVFTHLAESPKTSGDSSKSNINDFSVFGQRKIAENIYATATLDFSLYSATFSGQGTRVDENGAPETATSMSQRHTVLSGGIIYMF